jgi:uncharacterized ParB-like nuclease family protein
LSKTTTKKLNVDLVDLSGGTQVRKSVDQERITLFAENMKDGDVFPPIDVFHDGSTYWLSSGFHRYFAVKSLGKASIECNIHTGTLLDAIWFALGANAQHGLPLSVEDKRAAICKIIEHEKWKSKTNAEIARHVGASKMMVTRVKADLQAKGELKDESDIKEYTNKHGKTNTINTAGIKKANKERTKQKPEKTEEPSDELAEAQQLIQELSETVVSLKAENELLRDKIAVGQWDASEIEKIDIQETVNDLREQVRVLEIDNKALRESRDTYQTTNADLMKTVKTLQNKLKKLEK